MQKNYTQLLLGLVIGLVAGLLIAKFVFTNKAVINNPTPVVNYPTTPQNNNRHAEPTNNNTPKNNNSNEKIPDKVYNVLKYIKANGEAMDGYVGGRVFTNRERILPMANNNGEIIQYQEWDVNPKIQGQNRGTERICTGNDGRSWYTNDHYKSFTEIK